MTESVSKKLGNVIQIDEEQIQQHLGNLVRGTVRPLKNRPHFRFYTSGEFFQKNSANTGKKLDQISRFESVFPHYEPIGIHNRLDS
jgi:hypothetical protein